MVNTIIKIGTRESPLAVWQAQQVQTLLSASGIYSELVYIKSEGDNDLITPLYALGVQGIFTKALDAALLNYRIDIAVHSMKDVPVQMAQGIQQAAVLKRGNWKDIFVYKNKNDLKNLGFDNGLWLSSNQNFQNCTIGTSSTRRMAQWLHKYPHHTIVNLRGNVNTRLRKLNESNWQGAIFAAAGLERINLRPDNAIDIDWMLPAPAQGAIVATCRENDITISGCLAALNDEATSLCTRIERDFLRELMGGCSTPIGAIAEINKNKIFFKANILSNDGKEKVEMNFEAPLEEATVLGKNAAGEILKNGGQSILDKLKNDAGKK